MTEALYGKHNFYVSSLTNLAVGGTSVFTGLARLIKTDAHKTADVLLIEYSLNDSVFNSFPGFFDLWGEAYEGLIRKAISDNPFLIVIPIILGKKNGPYRRRIDPISSGVHTIARRYSLQALDINEMMLAKYQDNDEYDRLYVDVGHYARPDAAREIGQAVAAHIARFGERNSTAVSVGSIPPIYAKNLSVAKYLSKFKDVAGLATGKTYKNSMFHSETTFLPPGAVLTMALTGRIHLIEFVSTPSSSDLHISLNDESFRQHTTRKTFAGTKMQFLLGAILPDFHARRSIKGLKSSVKIEVLDNAALRSEVVPTSIDAGAEAAGPLRGPIRNANPGFSLEGILYSGILKVQ